MHHFKAKVGSVKDVRPRWDDTVIGLNNTLIEIKSVEVEGHGADAEGGKPDSNDRPRCKEEVQ